MVEHLDVGHFFCAGQIENPEPPAPCVVFWRNTGVVDTATGGLTLVGPTGIERVGGLAFDFDGTLYAAGKPLGSTEYLAYLYTIDVGTGVATMVGWIDVVHASGWLEGDLSVSPVDGELYAWHEGGFMGELYVVDKATGHVTFVVSGYHNDAADISGLAFRADGTLLGVALTYTIEPDLFVEIDIATGVVTTIGETGLDSGVPSVAGMSIDPGTGVPYLTVDTGLYTVDVATGAAALVGSHSPTNIGGLAFLRPATAIFSDGFETGGTTAWTEVVP
jgi:hypothetical protein